MKNDPRNNNIWFNKTSLSSYFSDYKNSLELALNTIKTEELDKAYDLMKTIASKGGTFFVAGNGGSAAIAEHLCCDWTKGTFESRRFSLRTHSLTSNSAMMTAIGNDFGYEFIFGRQLEMLAKSTDALFVISSSGNSSNIIRALEIANKIGLPSIALTGFSGGKAKELATVKLHVDFANYAIVEDSHQAIMQVLAQYFFVAQEN